MKNCLQVILRSNLTEVGHSQETIGIEVFAEPNSKVCMFGSKPLPAVSNTQGPMTKLDEDINMADIRHNHADGKRTNNSGIAMSNVLESILQKEINQRQPRANAERRSTDEDSRHGSLEGWFTQEKNNNEDDDDQFSVFTSGSEFWFFYCGNTRYVNIAFDIQRINVIRKVSSIMSATSSI